MADHPGGRASAGSEKLDAWLNEPVRPLLPQPGAFEQIRHRARRRKLRQTALSAAGVVVLVAVGITVPRLVVPQLSPSRPIANGTPAPQHSLTHRQPTPGGSSGLATSPTPVPRPTPTAAALPSVPVRFQVSSATFVGLDTGWVIGQAGVPGKCGPHHPGVCISIARTDDRGKSWYGVNAPAPRGAPHGVSQIRFLDTQNGWAFGPQLWATHDGGATWTQVKTHGMQVTALETRDGRAFAVWARCGGTVLGGIAGCTDFSLYFAPAARGQWTRIQGTGGLGLGGSPSLVLTGSGVYLLTPGGTLLSGTVTGTVRLRPAGGVPALAPCGPSQNGGQPPHALLSSTGNGLALLCPGTVTGGNQPKPVYYSGNGGATWHRAGTAPSAGTAASLAGTPGGALVVGTDQGIDVSTEHRSWPAASWHPAAGGRVFGGFSYVGMTSDAQGVAIPVNKQLHAVWFTYDGGLNWAKSPVR